MKLAGLLGAAALLLTVAAARAAPAGDAARGRIIFRTGETAEGATIQAAMGEEGFEVPAKIVPCASCHGIDGRGRPEGGILPSDLRWEVLSRSTGIRHPNGREHPPYDDAKLLRAFTMGLDPAGNQLDKTMPRYRFTRRDADDLVAYLKLVGTEKDPGVTPDRLRLGTLLPAGSGDSHPIAAVLRAEAAELNRRGGVYGRRLEIVPISAPPPGSVNTLLSRAIADADVFALVAPLAAGAEKTLAAVARELAIPVVGPFVYRTALELPPNRYVFHLVGGVEEQVRTLVEFAGKQLATGDKRLLVWQPDGGSVDLFAEAEDQAMVAGFSKTTSFIAAGTALLPTERAEAVLFLGSDAALSQFLGAARSSGWRPQVFVPGQLAGSTLLEPPEGFDARLYAAFPSLPSDLTPEGSDRYARLAATHALPATSRPSQQSALAATTLLTVALERAGRDLSREKVVAELEKLYAFETGLAPPVTFTANRRLGAPGAHVVQAKSGTLVPVGDRLVAK